MTYGLRSESRKHRGGCNNSGNGSVVLVEGIGVDGGGFEGMTRTNPQVLSEH